jgi:hypothetical protein
MTIEPSKIDIQPITGRGSSPASPAGRPEIQGVAT